MQREPQYPSTPFNLAEKNDDKGQRKRENANTGPSSHEESPSPHGYKM